MTIPVLIRGLGTDRFGVLTLVWMVLGYFSLFDLGLGRALTKLVAERLGLGLEGDIPDLVWTALGLMMALGLAGTALVILIAPWLVRGVLQIPGPLQGESLVAFYLLAASLPFLIVTAGLRGVMEAYQRVGLINLVNEASACFRWSGLCWSCPSRRPRAGGGDPGRGAAGLLGDPPPALLRGRAWPAPRCRCAERPDPAAAQLRRLDDFD